MKLATLNLCNFKALGSAEQQVVFRPITLLFGPNSAGKSTIVQALHYLSEILARNNCDPGTTELGGKLNLGGFRNLVHGHDADTPIVLALGLELDNSLLPSYGGANEDEHVALGEVLGSEELFDLNRVQTVELQLEVRWSRQLDEAYVSTYSVSVDGEHFATIASTPDQKQIALTRLNSAHQMFALPLTADHGDNAPGQALEDVLSEFWGPAAGGDSVPFQLRDGRAAMPVFGQLLPLEPSSNVFVTEETDTQSGGGPVSYDELQSWATASARFTALQYYLSRVMVGTGELVRDCLQEFLFLGPLREIPGRHYIPELSPGLARWSSGLGAWDQLYSEGEALAKKVNAWLANDQRLDAGYEVRYKEFKPLPLDSALMVALRSDNELLESSDFVREQLDALPTRREITLLDQRTGIDLYPEDLGTGISQVLPVLIAALGHNKKIVAIEQPELHVHPKFQVELGELFIHAVKEEAIARDTVFILETHSEYMMLRFLRRLNETANDELEPDGHALTPEDVAVYYVNPVGDETEIVHLRLDEEGEFLDRWPQGFFPERKRELF